MNYFGEKNTVVPLKARSLEVRGAISLIKIRASAQAVGFLSQLAVISFLEQQGRSLVSTLLALVFLGVE